MYAVIETGGKQYRVEVGTELEVELLDVEPGQSITLERVLLVADGSEAAVGQPVVADAAVQAEVVGQDRADKVIAFKYRPKARRRVKKGHRQDVTVLRIADITFNGKSAAQAEAKAEDARKTERQRLEEAAARQAAEDAALAAKLAVGSSKEAPKRGRAKAADAPAKAGTTEAKAAPKSTTKAAETAPAPKRARAKADSTESTAKTDAAPKRSRTKKDE
jgi:large subunit ribosomal protein L21